MGVEKLCVCVPRTRLVSNMLLKHISAAVLPAVALSQSTCNQQTTQQGIVCTCDSSGCDSVTIPDLQSGDIFAVQSQDNKFLWSAEQNYAFAAGQEPDYSTPDEKVTITIGHWNGPKQGPTVKGFGGLMNDATAINMDKVESDLQYSLLQQYFDANSGLGYDTLRIPMAGTEQSTRFYTYDDADYDDMQLTDFNLAPEDTEYKIPLTARIKEYFFPDGGLKTMASPWTAPPWMKTTDNYIGYGSIIGHPHKGSRLDQGFFDTWSMYFVKFLNAYKAQGMEIESITLQNLPTNGMSDKPYLPIPQTAWNPVDEGLFFTDYLWPTFVANGLDNTKIYICDDYTPELGNDIKAGYSIAQDAGLYSKIAGAGIHWEFDASLGDFTNLIIAINSNRDPTKQIITTGGGTFSTKGTKASTSLGNWQHGEKYSNGLMMHLGSGSMTYIDGTMVVDMAGGPNCTYITADAPIVISDDGATFYKNPSYYHMAHIFKFMPQGTQIMPTQKVGLNSNRLTVLAGDDNSGRRSIVLLNKDSIDIDVQIYDEPAGGTISMTLPAKSITSFMWQE